MMHLALFAALVRAAQVGYALGDREIERDRLTGFAPTMSFEENPTSRRRSAIGSTLEREDQHATWLQDLEEELVYAVQAELGVARQLQNRTELGVGRTAEDGQFRGGVGGAYRSQLREALRAWYSQHIPAFLELMRAVPTPAQLLEAFRAWWPKHMPSLLERARATPTPAALAFYVFAMMFVFLIAYTAWRHNKDRAEEARIRQLRHGSNETERTEHFLLQSGEPAAMELAPDARLDPRMSRRGVPYFQMSGSARPSLSGDTPRGSKVLATIPEER